MLLTDVHVDKVVHVRTFHKLLLNICLQMQLSLQTSSGSSSTSYEYQARLSFTALDIQLVEFAVRGA